MRANKKVDIHTSLYGCWSKVNKKKKVICERWERSTFNVSTSHIRWRNCYGSKCAWWTGWCVVMSYLAAVARYDCSHLLQVRSTCDRPTSAQANLDTLSSGQKLSEALHSHNDVSSPPSDKIHSSDIQKKIWLTPFNSNEQQIVLSSRFFFVNWMNQFTKLDWTVWKGLRLVSAWIYKLLNQNSLLDMPDSYTN